MYENKSCEIPFHFDFWSTKKKKRTKSIITNYSKYFIVSGNDNKIFSVNQHISIYYYYHIYLQYTKFEGVFLHLSMMNFKNSLRVFIMIGNVWFIKISTEYDETVEKYSNDEIFYICHNRRLNIELPWYRFDKTWCKSLRQPN